MRKDDKFMEYPPYGVEERMSDQQTIDFAICCFNGEVLLHEIY